MAKGKTLPPFLKGGGADKNAQGTEPFGAKSKKLPKVKPSGFAKPAGNPFVKKGMK